MKDIVTKQPYRKLDVKLKCTFIALTMTRKNSQNKKRKKSLEETYLHVGDNR